jgi:hypothetical protein
MDSIIFFLFNYIIKNKEQFKMNKISNDKIEKKNLMRKFNKNPILRMKQKKKTKTKKFGQAKHVGLGGPVCLDLKKNPRGDLYD